MLQENFKVIVRGSAFKHCRVSIYFIVSVICPEKERKYNRQLMAKLDQVYSHPPL